MSVPRVEPSEVDIDEAATWLRLWLPDVTFNDKEVLLRLFKLHLTLANILKENTTCEEPKTVPRGYKLQVVK